MAGWLIDERADLTERDLAPEVVVTRSALRTRAARPNLAVRLNDVVVHDAKKWFGGADIRLDAIVVTGDDDACYRPQTARFPGVKDGDRLPIFEPGLLVYLGRPRHFIDIAITVSRDRGDTEDLAELIADRADSSEVSALSSAVESLAGGTPKVAMVLAAVQSAAAMADWAVKLLGSVTGHTVGLYRSSFLQKRDKFGVGRHPETGSYRSQDLSFWYEIVPDR